MTKAPVGVRMMYNLTHEALGNIPIRPVKPCYIFSTDDSVVYIFEGKGDKEINFRLCSKVSTTSASHSSKYKIDDSSKMKGLRVKMTFIFSAVGTSAPIFITVYGLNEREMPHDKSIIVPLKGLCIGGGGVNMSGTTIGHVLFMRKQENADSIRYTHYLKNVLLPFIQESRFQFDAFLHLVSQFLDFHQHPTHLS